MSGWEYKIVPAPTKGIKGQGIKGPEGRFANALEVLMNEMAQAGWEFQRAETLPSTERSGLTGRTTEWRNLLVFRRTVVHAANDFEPELLPAPREDARPDPVPAAMVASEAATAAQDDADFAPGKGATEMLADNGVEETSEVAGMTTSLKSLADQRSTTADEKSEA